MSVLYMNNQRYKHAPQEFHQASVDFIDEKYNQNMTPQPDT